MADVLEVGAVINLGQILPGLDQLAAKTEATTSQMQASFTRLQSGLVLSQSAMFDLEAEGANIGSRVVPGIDKMPPALGRAAGAGRGAREAMRGIGEEMGVHLPRFVSSFLASVGPIGGIMAAAFAPIAIIGLIEFLGRIPDAISSMTDSIMGFGEAQKKVFADAVKDSDEAFIHTKNLAEAEANLHQTVKVLGDMAHTTFAERWVAANEEAARSTSRLMSALGLGALAPAVTGIMAVHKATVGAADAQTAWQEKQNALLKTTAEDEAAHQEKLLANKTEYLKLGEIGTSAYAKTRAELSILNLEEAEQISKLSQERGDQSENIRLTRELYAAKREGIEKTAGLEAGGEALGLAKAQIDGAKSRALALVNAQLEASKQIVEIDKTQWGQLISAERDAEEQRYAIEVNALNREKSLAAQRQALTGKNEAAQIEDINDKIETLGTAHAAKMRSIAADETKDEMSDMDRLQAFAVENFAKQQKATKDDADAKERGVAENIRLYQEQYSIADELASKSLLKDEKTNADWLKNRKENTAAWLKNEETAIDEWYSKQRAVLADELRYLEQTGMKESQEYRKVISQMEALDLEHKNKLEQANQTAWQSFQKAYQKIDSMINADLARWITGHQTFGKTVVAIATQIETAMVNYFLKMAEQYILGLLFHKTAAVGEVQIAAGVAAANAYAAEAAVPIIGPELAPAYAAIAYAQTLGWGSFDEGGLSKKTGLAMIHQNEITMPVDVSTGFRSILAGGGFGGSRVTHNHNTFNLNHNGPDARQVLETELVPRIQQALRRGSI